MHQPFQGYGRQRGYVMPLDKYFVDKASFFFFYCVNAKATCSSLVVLFSFSLIGFKKVLSFISGCLPNVATPTFQPLTQWPPGALWGYKLQQRNWFPFLMLLCLLCSCRDLVNVIKGLFCWSFKEVTSFMWKVEESWEYNLQGICWESVGALRTTPLLLTSHTCSCRFSADPIMPALLFWYLCAVHGLMWMS